MYAQSSGDAILGTWFTENGKAKVNVYKENSKYHGRIIWLRDSLNAEGKPKLDKHNPDAKLKTRTVKGILVVRDFQWEGDNLWENGKIYDPENGKDYSCKMTLTDSNTLEVRGFIGISLIGRTTIWKRKL